jgi:hypothetical protein
MSSRGTEDGRVSVHVVHGDDAQAARNVIRRRSWLDLQRIRKSIGPAGAQLRVSKRDSMAYKHRSEATRSLRRRVGPGCRHSEKDVVGRHPSKPSKLCFHFRDLALPTACRARHNVPPTVGWARPVARPRFPYGAAMRTTHTTRKTDAIGSYCSSSVSANDILNLSQPSRH